jgi:hypothetical protein
MIRDLNFTLQVLERYWRVLCKRMTAQLFIYFKGTQLRMDGSVLIFVIGRVQAGRETRMLSWILERSKFPFSYLAIF